MFVIQNIKTTETSSILMHCLKSDQKHIRSSLEAPSTEIGVPVGSVEFVRSYMAVNGFKEPSWNCYPAIPYKFYGRPIMKMSLGELMECTLNPLFYKPLVTKLFNGFLWDKTLPPDEHTQEQLDAIKNLPMDTEVYASTPINLICEVRYYVQDQEIIGLGRYDDHEQEYHFPDRGIVKSMIESIGIKTPYALDVGLTDDHRTLLIEVNDAWAIGLYERGLTDSAYANFLASRWATITNP